jgi:hypothetical protein
MISPVLGRHSRRARSRPGPLRARHGLLPVVTLVVVAAAAIVGNAAGSDPRPHVLWGMGDQIPAATQSELFHSGSAGMVTTWFNGPDDVSWITGYSQPSTVSDLYGAGRSTELVVWLGDHPDYAVSDQFQQDLHRVVAAMKGSGPHYGPLYVVLFSEWETYSSEPGYDQALRQAYFSAVGVIHQAYAQAEVALGFGGYEWTSTPTRDLSFWQDAIAASDFTAVQAMQDCRSRKNGQSILVPQIRASVQQLGTYGKPVMISHFKLWGTPGCQAAAFTSFAKEMFTDESMGSLTRDHLFAWGFMDDDYLIEPFAENPEIRQLIERFAR